MNISKWSLVYLQHDKTEEIQNLNIPIYGDDSIKTIKYKLATAFDPPVLPEELYLFCHKTFNTNEITPDNVCNMFSVHRHVPITNERFNYFLSNIIDTDNNIDNTKLQINSLNDIYNYILHNISPKPSIDIAVPLGQ